MPSQWAKGLAALTGGGDDDVPAAAAEITQPIDEDGVIFEIDSDDDMDFAKAGGAAFGMAEDKNTLNEPSELAQTKVAAAVEPLTALAAQAATIARASKRPAAKKAPKKTRAAPTAPASAAATTATTMMTRRMVQQTPQHPPPGTIPIPTVGAAGGQQAGVTGGKMEGLRHICRDRMVDDDEMARKIRFMQELKIQQELQYRIRRW